MTAIEKKAKPATTTAILETDKAPTPMPAKVISTAVVPAKTAKKTVAKRPSLAAKPVAKVAPKVPAKPIGKVTPKASITPAAKRNSEKELKEKKPKLVRDSFTIPKAEYMTFDELKHRAGKLGISVKKSELIRAGIKALAEMSDVTYLSALKAVPPIKTGRPSKN